MYSLPPSIVFCQTNIKIKVYIFIPDKTFVMLVKKNVFLQVFHFIWKLYFNYAYI